MFGTGRDPLERFLEKTASSDTTDCVEWTATKDQKGYGKFSLDAERETRAHRFAYETFVGPIPDGYVVDHLCGNKSCVNPAHLEAVTNTENLRRYWGAQTTCRNGHPRSSENVTYRRGRLICLACERSHYMPTRNRTGAVRSVGVTGADGPREEQTR